MFFKKNKNIGKNFSHIAWEEAFLWEGCPLCFLVNRGLWKIEDNFLYELVNDSQIRERIRENNGFCPEHTLQLLNFNDTLGISIIFEDIIKNVIIPSLAKKILPEKINCIFCEKEKEILELYIFTLPDVLRDERGFLLWKEKAYSFCHPHLEVIKEKVPEDVWKIIEKENTIKKKKYPEYLYGSLIWDKDYSLLFLKKLRVQERYKK